VSAHLAESSPTSAPDSGFAPTIDSPSRLLSDTEREVFEALLTPLLGPAYGTALHLTRNAADAEDMVQEASLNAFRGFASFEQGSNFRAWFFRILVNCVYSRHRRTRRQGVEVELEDGPELYLYCQTAAAGLHGQTKDPGTELMSRLDQEAISEALESLPTEYRVVATLYFMQDLAYQDIAEIVACPVGTVRSRLHRARRLLQKHLWRIAEERGITCDLLNAQEGE
jgi:RNA polymerase sigma-70 factor (ECF subfamily)